MAFVRYYEPALSGTLYRVAWVYETQAAADADVNLSGSTAYNGSVDNGVEPMNWFIDTSDGSVTDDPELPSATLISLWRQARYDELREMLAVWEPDWGLSILRGSGHIQRSLMGIVKIAAAVSMDSNYTNASVRSDLETACRDNWNQWHFQRQASDWPNSYFDKDDRTVAHPTSTYGRAVIMGCALPAGDWTQFDLESALWG